MRERIFLTYTNTPRQKMIAEQEQVIVHPENPNS